MQRHKTWQRQLADPRGDPWGSPTFCTDCKRVHCWPELKFRPGDRARIIECGRGYNHRDRVGQVVTVTGFWRLWSMPCDEPQYATDLGRGAILESRLEPVD